MPVRVLLVPIAILMLSGCGGSDDVAAPPPTTVDGPSLEGVSTDPAAQGGGSAETALLVAVRATSHPAHDRVVFEFANGGPGYDVRYVDPPVLADGSGAEVAVAGTAVLLVRMEPALDADLTQESAPPTYTGPTRFSPNATAVVELVRVGGFEAVLTWAIGVDEKRPFRVTRLDRAVRIVLDLSSSG